MDEIECTGDDEDGDNGRRYRSSRFLDLEKRMNDLRNDDVILEAQRAQTRRQILAEIRRNRLRGEKRQVDLKHYRL